MQDVQGIDTIVDLKSYSSCYHIDKLKECFDKKLNVFWKNAYIKIRIFWNELTETNFFSVTKGLYFLFS